MYRRNWWSLKGNADIDSTVYGEDEEDVFEQNGEPFNPNECMVENMMTALEGCIMLDLLPLATNEGPTVSGKVCSQILQLTFHVRRGISIRKATC